MLLLFRATPLTRLYLASTVSTGVNPSFGPEWEHLNGGTFRLAVEKSGSILQTMTFSEGVDHLVDADVLLGRWITPRLSAQTLPATSLTLAIQLSQPDANDHLSLAWKLFVWHPDNTLGPTLIPFRRDDIELATTLLSRVDSVALAATTIGSGDRLVLELGAGGQPVDAAGVQGHTATVRVGEDGTADLGGSDGEAGTTLNPWLLVGVPLVFAPATSGFVMFRGRAALGAQAQRAIDPVDADDWRIPDNWDQVTANGLKASTTSIILRGQARREAVAAPAPATTTTVSLRAVGRDAVAGGRAAGTSPLVRASASSTQAAAKGGLTQVSLTAGAAGETGAVQGGLTAVELAAGGRLLAAVARASAAISTLTGRSQSASAAVRTGLGVAGLHGAPAYQLVGARAAAATLTLTASARSLASVVRGALTDVELRGSTRAAATVTRTGTVSLLFGAAGRVSGVGAKAVGTVVGTLRARGQLSVTSIGEALAAVTASGTARLAVTSVKAALTASTQRAIPTSIAIGLSNATTVVLVRARGRLAAAAQHAAAAVASLRGGSRVTATTAKGSSTSVTVRGTSSVTLTVLVPASASSITMRAGSGLVALGARGGRGTAVTTAYGRMALAASGQRQGQAVLRAADRLTEVATTVRVADLSLWSVSRGDVLIGLAQIVGRVTAGAAAVGGVRAGVVSFSRVGAGAATDGDVDAGAVQTDTVEAGTAVDGRVLVGAGPR